MVDYTDIPIPKDVTEKMTTSWRKGYAAFLNNKHKNDCPYRFSRMARAYYFAWNRGWDTAKEQANLH